MTSYSIFDLIGPIMVGPSSSHTAGANRIGYMAKHIIGEPIKEVTFYLHGSFAKTYKGHGTDKALLAGILGYLPDDERIKDSFKYADEEGISYKFVEADLGDVHPNTTKLAVTTVSGDHWEITGSSIGGGKVKITRVNDMEVDFDGEYTSLITHHQDYPGIVAKITNILAVFEINIAFMKLFRTSRGSEAMLLIETDQDIPKNVTDKIMKIDALDSCKVIPQCRL